MSLFFFGGGIFISCFIYRVMENQNYFVAFYADVAKDVDKKNHYLVDMEVHNKCLTKSLIQQIACSKSKVKAKVAEQRMAGPRLCLVFLL